MTKPSSSAHRWLVARALFSAALLSSGIAAAAPATVYLWGYQRGCERLEGMDKEVETKLFREGRSVSRLAMADGSSLPPCSGGDCIQALRASCPAQAGRLLGGQVVQSKDVIQVRLWLHDFASAQTAYQDDFCQTCNLASALSAQTRALIEHPQFGSPPGPTPSYCAAQSPAPAPSAGPIFVSIAGPGDRQGKAALATALNAQLQALKRPVVALPGEIKSFDRDSLQRLVSSQKAARLLVVDLQKEAKASVTVFDPPSGASDSRALSCRDCDHTALALAVKEAVAELLDRCLGAQCAGVAAAPPTACQPFPLASCGSSALSALLDPQLSAAGPAGRHIDRGSARLVNGALWGLFAGSTVASGALLIANATAGTYVDPKGIPIENALWRPAWTAAGISIALLGVAIPVTVLINKAITPSQASQAGTGSRSPASIACLN
jgi:hypothetical protein